MPVLERLLLKIVVGTPVPGAVSASTPWCTSVCKHLSGQQPLGAEIGLSKQLIEWVQTYIPNFVVSGPKFTGLFSPNAGGIAVDTLVFRFRISIRFGDICDRSLKLSEVNPNFARFWSQIFLRGGHQHFGI